MLHPSHCYNFVHLFLLANFLGITEMRGVALTTARSRILHIFQTIGPDNQSWHAF